MKRLLLKRKGTHKRPPAWQSGGTRRRKDNAKRVGEKADDDDEYRSASDEDYSDTANERPSEYRKGGYHPVTIGEVYNARYRVVHKLGWGYFSTVWLVWDYDTESFKAMKVQKAASHYRDAAMDEIKLLSDIMHGDPRDCSCCAQMTDSFKHKGPNGIHVCMIFDVLGENILKLIERYEYRGIPLPIVKNIMKQVLQGLAYIHSLNIIHTDLKPENVLFSTPPHKIQRIMKNYQPPPDRSKGVLLVERDPKSLSKSQKKRLKKKIKAAKSSNPPLEEHQEEKNKRSSEPDHVKHESDDLSETDPEWEIERIQKVTLADFGNGCWTHTHFTTEIQTRQYRSPEVILGMHYDCSADLWSAACMCFELITGEFLFDPKQGEDYDRDEDHLALMIETLGPLPFKMTHGNGAFCHKLLNKKGELLHIQELRFWPLEKVLHEKYRFTKKKAREIANFLSPMLKYNIDERYTALEMLQEFENTFFVITESDYPAYCYIQNEFVEEKIDTDVVTDDSVDFEGLAEDLGISLEEIHSFLRGDLMNLPPDVMNVLKTVVAPASFQRTSNEEDEWDGDDELDELVRKQNKRTGKKVSRARSM